MSYASEDSDPVRLAVFFESLCPDSIRFMEDQLYPTWNNVPEIMDVDLNAYGFITETPLTGGGYKFECQHGPDECEGNLMLACAKNYITDQSQYVDFTLCVMMSDNPPYSGQTCADNAGIPFNQIDECWKSEESQHLLHEIGLQQNGLRPVVDWVPWIVLNDEHTDEIQADAESGLQVLLCSAYEGTKPAACQTTAEEL